MASRGISGGALCCPEPPAVRVRAGLRVAGPAAVEQLAICHPGRLRREGRTAGCVDRGCKCLPHLPGYRRRRCLELHLGETVEAVVGAPLPRGWRCGIATRGRGARPRALAVALPRVPQMWGGAEDGTMAKPTTPRAAGAPLVDTTHERAMLERHLLRRRAAPVFPGLWAGDDVRPHRRRRNRDQRHARVGTVDQLPWRAACFVDLSDYLERERAQGAPDISDHGAVHLRAGAPRPRAHQPGAAGLGPRGRAGSGAARRWKQTWRWDQRAPATSRPSSRTPRRVHLPASCSSRSSIVRPGRGSPGGSSPRWGAGCPIAPDRPAAAGRRWLDVFTEVLRPG
jgi:hypothetical protein